MRVWMNVEETLSSLHYPGQGKEQQRMNNSSRNRSRTATPTMTNFTRNIGSRKSARPERVGRFHSAQSRSLSSLREIHCSSGSCNVIPCQIHHRGRHLSTPWLLLNVQQSALLFPMTIDVLCCYKRWGGAGCGGVDVAPFRNIHGIVPFTPIVGGSWIVEVGSDWRESPSD